MRRFFSNIGAALLVLCGFTLCHEERPIAGFVANLGTAISDAGKLSEHSHFTNPAGQEAENTLRQLEQLAAEEDKEEANMAAKIQADPSSRESLFLLTNAWNQAHKAPGDSQYLIHVKDRPTLLEISALLVEQHDAPTRENLEKAFWDIAAEKDPSSCVNAIVPFLIRPTDPLSYDHVFGHPPSASQMSLVNAITTNSTEQIVGTINDNVDTLKLKINNNTSEGDLVVIVGHNIATQGEPPILKLASGPTDSISADEIYRIGEETNRKIVILCCWASESGITDEITYNQAISMISGIKQKVSASATAAGVHVGLVSYNLPNIFDAVADRSRTQRWLVITMVSGVTGSAIGWEGYECSTKDQSHRSATFPPPAT
jgi:hypothetical protein